MNITVTVPPDEEPVSVDEAKDWARITDASQDAVVEALVKLARQRVESFCGRALLNQTIVQRYDSWPRWFELLRAPVASFTSLQYIDTVGTTQTIGSSNYYTDLVSEPGRLFPVPSYSWPLLQEGRPNAVILTYVAGAADVDDVPETAKTAIKMLTRHWYDNEGAAGQVDMPEHIRDLLWPLRIP